MALTCLELRLPKHQPNAHRAYAALAELPSLRHLSLWTPHLHDPIARPLAAALQALPALSTPLLYSKHPIHLQASSTRELLHSIGSLTRLVHLSLESCARSADGQVDSSPEPLRADSVPSAEAEAAMSLSRLTQLTRLGLGVRVEPHA